MSAPEHHETVCAVGERGHLSQAPELGVLCTTGPPAPPPWQATALHRNGTRVRVELPGLEALHAVGGGWVGIGGGGTSLVTTTGTVRPLGSGVPWQPVFRSHRDDWCGVAVLPDGPDYATLVEIDDAGFRLGLRLYATYSLQPLHVRCGRSVRMLHADGAGRLLQTRGVWLAVGRPWRLYRTDELPADTWRKRRTDGAHFWVLLEPEDPPQTSSKVRSLSLWWNLRPTASFTPGGLGERTLHEVTVVPPARGPGPSAVWFREDHLSADGPDASSRYAVLPTRRGRPGELLRFPEGVHVQDLRLLPPGVCLVWTDAPGAQPRLTCGTWRDLRQAIETSDPTWFGALPPKP